METLFIGYSDALVRTTINGTVKHERVLEGVPVPMVAVDPGQPERVYAATLGQGLMRSDDGGRSFERVPSVTHDLVWAVVVSACDRNGRYGTVYAGTQMSALYRSTDGGSTFEELESVQSLPSKPTWSFPPAPDTHHVHQIALSSDDPTDVVFGVELGGVFHSSDRGETWETTTADPDPHTLRTHPSAQGRMYEGGGAAYHASRDGGATWVRNIDGIPDEVRYFYSLAVDSGDPENVLISGARDPFSGHAVIPGIPVWSAVYRLVDERWQQLSGGLPPEDGTPMGTLAAGGSGVFYYLTEPGEIYRSDDGGSSFALLNEGPDPLRGKKARSILAVND
jgi:photosystem II stability/assembly factor-like uncharacterized protein